MELTRKQKRAIEKLSRTKSADEISRVMHLPIESIFNFLGKSSVPKTNNKYQDKSFGIKKWLKENLPFLILFTVLVAVAYINSLGNKFLSDDIGIIEQRQDLGKFSYIFEDPFLFMRLLLYSIIYHLFGRNPTFFRLMNIFFHLGSIYLFFFIITSVIKKPVAIFATVIFAIHPILVENITWISGGFYPQYGFFLLLSLSLYILSNNNRRLFKWSIIAYLVSLFSAERGVYFPIILIAWEIVYGNIKQNWKKIIPYAILSSFWFFAKILGYVSFRVNSLQTNYYQKRSIANPLIQIPTALSSYFELIFWPKNLTLYHSELNFTKTNFVMRCVATASYFFLLIYTYIKNKQIFFWLFFFLVTLSPSLTPLNISWVYAERYVYLGSMGIFILVGYLIYQAKKYYKSEAIFYLILVVIAIPLLIRTIVRNVDWTDQDHLWLAAEKTSPSSHQNHNNLGDLWARRGDFQKAVEEFQKAIDLLPNYADAYHNMATSYHQLGKDDLALASYQKAIYFNPNLWQSYQNIGAIFFTRGDIANAEKFYAKATEINPNSTMLHTAMGIINLKKGNLKEANKEFGIAVSLDPQNQEAKAGFLQTKTN